MLFQFAPYSSGGGSSIQGLFQALVDWGFVDAFLPFLLLFVLLFGILQKIAIFGKTEGTEKKPDRRINGVLSFIIAAMVVVPHIIGAYPPGSDPVDIINQFLPSTAVILLAILCVILLLGLAGGEIPSLLLWVIALVALGFLIVMMLMAMLPGFLPTFGFLRDHAIQALIIILLTMGLIGYFVVREEPQPGTGVADWLNRWIGKPPT